MDKLKQWIALTVVAVIVIALGGWFFLIAPKRSEAADVRAQTAQQQSANAMLATQIQLLKAQAKALPQQQAKLAAVAAKVPDNPAVPALIRALSAAADDAGVELLSMVPTKPAPVAAPPVVAPLVAATGTAGSTSRRSTTGGGSAGTLQVIGVSLSVVGGYFQVEQFLDRIESLSRAMKVTSLTVAPGANPLKPLAVTTGPTGTLTASITGSVYMATGRTTATVGK